MCSWSYRSYSASRSLKRVRSERPSLLEGYEQVTPLPPGPPKLADAFICLAFVDTLRFHAPNLAELGFIFDELPLVHEALEQALL